MTEEGDGPGIGASTNEVAAQGRPWRLRTDIDLWVASASADARAYLVPLSYHWDGSTLTFATPSASPTAGNLLRAGWVCVALGYTRDVVIVEGTVEAVPIGADPELEDAHARSAGFDPRTLREEYVYLRITPQEIQAWRESNGSTAAC